MINQTYDGTLQDKLISQYPNINADEIKTVANDFLALIKEGLKKDNQVRINKFGTFRIKKVKDRSGVNPQTGEKIIIKAHNRVFFKPTKALLQRINASVLLDVKNAINDDKKYKVAAKHIDNVAQLVIKEEVLLVKPEETNNKRILAACLILGIVVAGVVLQFQQPEKQTPFIPKTFVAASSPSSSFSGLQKNTIENVSNNNGISQTTDTANSESVIASSSIPPIINSSSLSTEAFSDIEKTELLNNEDAILYDDVMYDEVLAINNTEAVEEIAEAENVQNIQTKTKTKTDASANIETLPKNTDVINADETIVAIESSNSIQVEARNEMQTLNKNVTSKTSAPFFAKKTYKLKYGDNLWNLAKSNYKAPILWPHIYHDNKNIITNPNKLRANKNIVIPQLEGEYGKLSDLDKRNVAEGYWLLYEHYKKTGNQFSTFALLGVKQFDSSVIDENKQMISKQDMDDFLAMADA